MKKIKTNGVSALGTTPVYASQLNAIVASLGVTNDGPSIPENVYPVADGEGGFLAGDIKITGTTSVTGNIAIGPAALQYIDSAAYANTAVGRNAGSDIIYGNGNVFLGDNAGNMSNQDGSAVESIGIGTNSYTTKNLQAVVGSNSITETYLRGMLINTRRYTPINVTTNPITADDVLYGVITCNNGSAMTLTLPTSTLLMAALTNNASIGTTFDMYVYNIGAGTVTIAMGTGITVHTPVTGAASEIMTVSQANAVGCFRFFCTSPTLNSETFKIIRVF